MRINVFDSWKKKFSHAMIDHWEGLGHEVHVNEEYGVPADIEFYYQADNAAQVGIEKSVADKIYTQCVDIEVFAGQPFGIDWGKVSGCLFMAEHIKEYVHSQMVFPLNVKLALIKPGIDTDKFTLRPKQILYPLKKIAYVVGDRRIWDVKRLDIAFQLLHDLMHSTKDIWQLHVRGTYSTHVQYNRYCQYLEKDLKLEGNVVWEEARIDDMNVWLEDKDYLLLPSTKEAFSYATAEAMSKGIKPIINNWEGAKKTWGPFVCETYGQMLAEITRGKYEPEVYRKYIVDNYEQKRYLREIDNFLGIV